MTSDMQMLQQTVLDAGLQSESHVIRLLNTTGEVIASSIPSEIGVQLDTSGDLCIECHKTNLSPRPSSKKVFSELHGNDEIITAKPIENRVSCQGCHSNQENALGLILMEHPTESIDSSIALLKYGSTIAAIVFAIIITGAIYLVLYHQVARPLMRLAGARSGRSDPGKDEIGRVAAHIHRLEADLADSEQKSEQQHTKIDSLLSIHYDTNNPPAIENFFEKVLGIIQEVTGFTSITIRLYEPKTQCFRLMAEHGLSQGMKKDLESIPANRGFHAEIVRNRLPAFTSDLASDPRLMSKASVSEGYRSLVCVPLLASDLLVGSMELATRDQQVWSKDELRWLALVGRRVGLLVYQIQLSERLRDMAVVEERSRIAQEIHDGLAQLIGSIRIWSEEAQISLEKDNLSAVKRGLQRIELSAREAFASLREEMLGLRDAIAPGRDLNAVVIEYLSRFQRQWGIKTQLKVDHELMDQQAWAIPPATEIQLLRAVQEGLINVRRHSKATSVTVKFSKLDGRLLIDIQDNGVGFDLENVSEDKLGLRIIRERMASVDGKVMIKSQPGEGTSLEIDVPIQGGFSSV